jgi:hypothetical protein
MWTLRFAAVVTVAAAIASIGPASRSNPPLTPDARQLAVQSSALLAADFDSRVQAYIDLRRRVEKGVPPLEISANPVEIRHAVDALAMAIREARRDARQGDIFTPAISGMFRRAVLAGCAEQSSELLRAIDEELEEPLPPAAVNARWPWTAPVPTMPPDLLKALPRLPRELQYRFMHRDLILHDIDANLIVDFVTDAIPTVTN